MTENKGPETIRVRRIENFLALVRRYEVQVERQNDLFRSKLTRSGTVGCLEPLLGIADAWSFVNAADRAWEAGDRSWAVEYERIAETST